jgi:hypothetical protein
MQLSGQPNFPTVHLSGNKTPVTRWMDTRLGYLPERFSRRGSYNTDAASARSRAQFFFLILELCSLNYILNVFIYLVVFLNYAASSSDYSVRYSAVYSILPNT